MSAAKFVSYPQSRRVTSLGQTPGSPDPLWGLKLLKPEAVLSQSALQTGTVCYPESQQTQPGQWPWELGWCHTHSGSCDTKKCGSELRCRTWPLAQIRALWSYSAPSPYLRIPPPLLDSGSRCEGKWSVCASTASSQKP